MFVHASRLQHLLSPADYHDPGQYQRELDRLFLPAWHVVGTTDDLSQPGNFLTLDLLGQPLLVRNIDGAIHTFLNVCAHRHCMLTSKPSGHDPLFRCQYHGWEYDRDGHTARIPDARCFRPFDRENAHLRKCRTERCGELIFVSLSDDGPDLRAFLGPYHDFCQASFASPWRLAWTWETTYQANWKVPIENSLESYHIPCLHAKSFGKVPAEESCTHDLAARYTTFRTPEPDQLATRIQAWFVRRLGLPLTRTYTHHHAHPHLTISSLDVMRLLQMILPTSPTSCVHRVWLYVPRGRGWNPWKRGLARTLGWAVKLAARQIILEDAPIFARVQRGLEASVHPGVLGTREERVFVFQEYVRDALTGRSVVPS
jgi:phenylpropionate dioxygenase-like ring-hydroxylating dioxygenase large terminal subunit